MCVTHFFSGIRSHCVNCIKKIKMCRCVAIDIILDDMKFNKQKNV